MTPDSPRIHDPHIESSALDKNKLSFEQNGDTILLQPGTIVSGTGDQYFEGTVTGISASELGTEHHVVTFTDVQIGTRTTDEHRLPLGELAAQIEENDLSVQQP